MTEDGNDVTLLMEQRPDRTELMRLLRALADPNRLRIFEYLMEGDSCNCELNEKLGLPSNLLSHHLRVLREAGLITSRRDIVDNRWIYYSVNREAVARWRSWFAWFFDPKRVRKRAVLCGPEGALTVVNGDRSAVGAGLCTVRFAEEYRKDRKR